MAGKRVKRAKKVLDPIFPIEIVEEILLYVPVKSLRRFSAVSKGWKSMISESRFVKRYRGRQRIFSTSRSSSTSTVSSISSSSTPVEFESVVCPFGEHPSLMALCNELWLASVGESLFLWNPSTRTYIRLPNPSNPSITPVCDFAFAYGLGYDSVADDYKILQIKWSPMPLDCCTKLYSLRSDLWRDIPKFSPKLNGFTEGLFVSGNLHWMSVDDIIIFFDLSTEEFGEVPQPNYSTTLCTPWMSVLRAMLCVSMEDMDMEKCDVWVMEDYGVTKSWTKQFSIKRFYSLSGHYFECIRPLYYYKNGEVLIRAINDDWDFGIFVYKDDKTTPREVIVYSANHKDFVHGFVHADSLVAPEMWSTTKSKSDSIHELTR